MGNVIPITLLKLGGSLITNKDKRLSLNNDALKGIAGAIARSGLPSVRRRLIIVHGGGSFGHYYAKKFGLTVERKFVAPLEISKTSGSMMQLHSIVLKTLVRSGVAAETIMAQELISSRNLMNENGLGRVRRALEQNLVPVSFGNVGFSGTSAYIISGDAVCEAIFFSMPVDRLIFAMDVDGLYPSAKLKGNVLRILTEKDEIETAARKFDVTGGIQSKISLGFRVARAGAEVLYVNGKKPKRLLKLLRSADSSKVRATVIMRSKKRELAIFSAS